MPKFDIDFRDVPDEFQPIPPGTYTLECDPETPPEVGKSKAGNDMLVVVWRVGPGFSDNSGRRVKDYVVLSQATTLKRIALSAGIELDADGSYASEDLIGKRVRAVITNRSFVDPETQEERDVADLRSYLIPGDQGYEE